MVSAYIALGSNLGDRRRHLDVALARLDALPRTRLRRASRFHNTPPVGPGEQRRYLNAVAALDTRLDPWTLHALLAAIERAAGRASGTARRRWAARTLDLDLLLWDRAVIDTPTLSVPHPRLHERTFVLKPLAELAPDLRHPITGQSVIAMLRTISTQRPKTTWTAEQGSGS